ncbi:GCN5 family acetyltransferase [Vibrio galatheae]|uniref:GCN5 family acetyltransferase n=1 Tax=Vibrio galatheae TaxID=579748 RepID=A0A0F4NLS6_9VIBR|nr:GNAT family N-acetyltransferase [Vibrio galatheae]KJY83829.1 GCN5 family acetyltransferase [Vibrio galatheae]
MKLSLIALKDADTLLAFEIDNQHWFEQFIPPREKEFYSQEGVTQHIREFLLDYQCNEMIPLLIKTLEGEIVGRINVTNINSVKRSAHLGYRIGQDFTNQGVAKWAVAEVTKIIKARGVKRLFAYAATSNPASQRVLTQTGFCQGKVVKDYTELHGKSIDCVEYRLNID